MKRSEMIEIMIDVSKELRGQRMGPDFERDLMNLILDAVEKANMLPPIIPNTYIHKWEPEDEAK